MFKKMLFALGLMAACSTFEVSAQCAAGQMFLYNGSNCLVEVEVFYGDGCDTYGSVTQKAAANSGICISIPSPWSPVETILHDPASGQYASLYPGCGSSQEVTYEDCAGFTRTFSWNSTWSREVY